jgi:hypothetical protein
MDISPRLQKTELPLGDMVDGGRDAEMQSYSSWLWSAIAKKMHL